MASYLMAPMVVFLIFVAPLWLILHYRSKKTSDRGLSSEEHEKLEALSAKAESLQQRVRTLEKILDTESPNWRSNYER